MTQSLRKSACSARVINSEWAAHRQHVPRQAEETLDSNTGRMRYFLTYHGVSLPLALSGELDPASVVHRGTYYRAQYDARGRMICCEKFVYGEVELEHVYEYDTTGRLLQARVTTTGEEPQFISFESRMDS